MQVISTLIFRLRAKQKSTKFLQVDVSIQLDVDNKQTHKRVGKNLATAIDGIKESASSTASLKQLSYKRVLLNPSTADAPSNRPTDHRPLTHRPTNPLN